MFTPEPVESQFDGFPHATAVRVLRLTLLGSNANPSVVGELELPGETNYIKIGNEPRQWRTDTPTYAQVTFTETYPGVDLRFHGVRGQLECHFVLGAGADPSLIKLGFDRLDGIDLDGGDCTHTRESDQQRDVALAMS